MASRSTAREDRHGIPRLLADEHLQRLARYLRAAGIDCACAAGVEDQELLRLAEDEHRVIITRDRALAAAAGPARAFLVTANGLHEQLAGVLRAFRLDPERRALSRCLLCNEPLETVSREEVAGEVPPLVYEANSSFTRCPACRRVFWEGTHAERLRAALRRANRGP